MSLPLSAIPKIIASYSSTLSSKIESTDTSLTLEDATDDAGNAITGVVALTVDGEYMIGTKSGTAVTGLLRGIDPQDGTSEVTSLKAAHQRGAVVKITDYAFLAIAYRLMNGTEGFPNQLKYVTSGYPTPVNDYDIPTKKYVVDTFAGGSVANVKIVIAGTAGETVAAGQLVYFKAADARWWLCDADTAATVDNIILGIAQGAGTAGNAVTSGVLLAGEDANQTGLSAGSTYYASNTAGAISSSAGTVEVTVGAAKSTTNLIFEPRYNQQLTEDQQDALAGTSGTPSTSNKYVTNDDTSATAAASKVVRSNGSSKIAEGYLNLTDAQATDLTDGGLSVAHAHLQLDTYSVTSATNLEASPSWAFATLGGGSGTELTTVVGAKMTAGATGTDASAYMKTDFANAFGSTKDAYAEFWVYLDPAGHSDTTNIPWCVAGFVDAAADLIETDNTLPLSGIGNDKAALYAYGTGGGYVCQFITSDGAGVIQATAVTSYVPEATWTRVRIYSDAGVGVFLYVGGTLRASHSTNYSNTFNFFGIGAAGNTTYQGNIVAASNPVFSVVR